MLIAEKDAGGATIATYLYDHADHPVSMTRGGKTYYYHYNAHGDTIALTDDSGNIAARYAYDICGNIISKEGDIDNPFTYGGQWGYIHDDESSLYFLKTRYYDPLIGRFISRDRFAGFENDPDSQNRYVYCNNDPVNNVDPSGEMLPLWAWLAISGAIIGGTYNLIFYLTHNKYTTVKGGLLAFLKGAVVGGLIGVLSSLPKAWIPGLWGAILAVANTISINKRLGRKTTAGQITRAVIAGWGTGVTSHFFTRYIKSPVAKTMIDNAISAIVGGYFGAW